MMPERLEPSAPRSRVKHSNAEPLPSLLLPFERLVIGHVYLIALLIESIYDLPPFERPDIEQLSYSFEGVCHMKTNIDSSVDLVIMSIQPRGLPPSEKPGKEQLLLS